MAANIMVLALLVMSGPRSLHWLKPNQELFDVKLCHLLNLPMYSALDVDLRPGQGFGIFEIGELRIYPLSLRSEVFKQTPTRNE